MKNLFTFLFVTLISVTGLFGQGYDAGDASFVKDWTSPVPSWYAKLPAEEPARAQATSAYIADFDATASFDASWAKISGDGFAITHQLGLNASATGAEDFKDAAFKVATDGSYIYILLKYTDDDVTGNESIEVAWAPYLKINAPELPSLPQAWYARYQQFGAYKASFKKTGFDAAMMIDGSTGSINWGGTNEILSNNLYLNDHTTTGSHTVKQIITIGFSALTGEARPDFDQDIWASLNEGKGISLDIKINDKDGDDAKNAKDEIKPAEYWWNSTNNDAYALTAYAGFIKAPVIIPTNDDASFVKDWTAPVPSWYAKLPAEEPARAQASSSFIADFDATAGFDAAWAKISGDGFAITHQLGLNASATGAEDFKDAAFKSCYDASYIYILLKYTDDDVTGNESVEVAWAPYLKINAPELASLPQAWYARYQQFGAYKAVFKKTGFDAAMMIDGSTGSINWGGTNEILSNNLYLNDHTTAGSKTVKQIITIGFSALTGEARPDFDQDIWASLNEGKGISLDLKVNDKDGDDAKNAKDEIKPAEYWWNSTNNDAYALTAYAGFLNTKGTITNVSPLETGTSIFGMTYSQRIQLTRNANVVIYNALGQQIKSFKNVNIVDISDLKSGIYIVRANNEAKKFFR